MKNHSLITIISGFNMQLLCVILHARNLLKTLFIVLLINDECIAQFHEHTHGRSFNIPQMTKCRPMEEVLRVGGCSPKQFLCSAEDRNNETVLAPSEMKRKTFLRTACFCDPDCWKFKDCCIDAAPVESAAFEDDIKRKCELLPGSKESIYVIASCPPDWNGPEEVELCERRVSDDDYNYVLDIPVFSNITRKAYSNIYCAKCHQDHQLLSFRIALICPSGLTNCQDMLHHAYYMFGEHKWQIYARGNHFAAYINLVVPEFTNWEGLRESFDARRCRFVVDSCSDNQFEYAENCTSYYSHYVQTGDGQPVYKNLYCALCNNVSLSSDIKCYSSNTLTNLPELYPGNYYCQPHPLYDVGILSGGLKPPSYSVLFDFHDPLGNNAVGLQFRCKIGEILDPIHDFCIPFKCRKHFTKVGGKCVPNESTDIQNEVAIRKNCRMIPYKKHEISVLFQNDSIFVNKTGITYERWDFEEYDNDTYLVCELLDSYVGKFSITQSYLSQIVMSVSLTCLALHIAIHTAIAKLRNLPGKNLQSLSIALFIAQALFLLGSSAAVKYPSLCTIIAIMTHFFFLASFFWMNVMAFDIYCTFTLANSLSNASHQSKTFHRYATYAWVTALFVISVAFIMDYTDVLPSIRPGYGGNICWLTHRRGLLVFFALPLALLLAANIIFFSMTTYEIHRTTKLTRSVVQMKKDKIRFFLYVKLALIMGLTWVTGYVAGAVNYEPLWYVFIIFNGSQGAFIFFAFSFKRKFITLLVERIKGNTSESTGGSSVTSNSTKYITANTKTSSDQGMACPSVENVNNSNSSSASVECKKPYVAMNAGQSNL